MDTETKLEKDEWFSIVNQTIDGSPHAKYQDVVVFEFSLEENELIRDLIISSSEPHEHGDLFGDGNHLMSAPKWQSDFYVDYTYPSAQQMVYDKMVGRGCDILCAKCQEPLNRDPKTNPRKLYLPFSTEPATKKNYELMSNRWKKFRVEVRFAGPAPPNTTLVLSKIIKRKKEMDPKDSNSKEPN